MLTKLIGALVFIFVVALFGSLLCSMVIQWSGIQNCFFCDTLCFMIGFLIGSLLLPAPKSALK